MSRVGSIVFLSAGAWAALPSAVDRMKKHTRAAAPRRSLAGAALSSALSLAWVALVVAAPLAAAWVASSLAAHGGGSVRAAAASGLLVFPVLPALWEAASAWRRSRRGNPRPRVLTLVDRMVMRTLAVSLTLIGALLARDPQRAFVALNSRGDWMLDGRHDAGAEAARRRVFWLAARSEWLFHLTDENPFHAGATARPPRPNPAPGAAFVAPPTGAPRPVVEAPPEPPRDARAWPWPLEMHPAVRALPASAETSPEAVGRYLAAHENDPWRLARAVHDYVADRVEYDVASYRAGVYPPQDAATTFRTRRSVCAGYAALFEAIGRAAGLTVETVVGRARGVVTEGMGEGHAWSAVKLDGRWHLVDTTWDAGYVSADGFHKRYRTEYFLTPPAVFLAKHFPDEARWQLMDAPRSAGEYMRAPTLDPRFFAEGMRLVAPSRAESDARSVVEVVIENPRRRSVLIDVAVDGGARLRCPSSGEATVTARCALAGGDLHTVTIFVAARGGDTHWSVGSLRVHNR